MFLNLTFHRSKQQEILYNFAIPQYLTFVKKHAEIKSLYGG
jgi:hypothetical protein